MGTNEDYLDNLLKTAMESEQKNQNEEPDPLNNEPEEIEEIEPEPIEEKEPEPIEYEPEQVESEPEPIDETILPTAEDDPNRQLSADEIAEMLAMMDALDPGETADQEKETEIPEAAIEETLPGAVQPEAEPQPEAAIEETLPGVMEEEVLPEEVTEESRPEAVAAEILPEETLPEETQPEPEKVAQPEEELEIDLNSIDDLDSLLGLRELPPDHTRDDKAEEEPETAGAKDDRFEGQDVTELLDLLGDDDSDLAEINELLKKSDRNEKADDDDMLAMLAGISDLEGMDESTDLFEGGSAGAAAAETGKAVETVEESGEETGKKNKKKIRRKKKKKADRETEEEQNPGAEEITDQTENEAGGEKKTGFFGKLLQALTEEDDDEEEQMSEPEAEGEPKGAAAVKKKGKKDKKKKGGKTPETNEEILEELAEEDAAKAKNKKKKKPQKEKKKKEEKQPVLAEPSKKLPKKMIIRLFVLCFSLLAVILVVALFLPGVLQVQNARRQFYGGNYEEAYQSLTGQNLNESDQILLQKAEMIVRLERKADAYQAYRAAGDEEEALNALLEGVAYYWQHDGEYDGLGIREDAEQAYTQLLVLLETEYSITEERAKELIALDSISYTYEIRSLVGADAVPPLQTDEAGQETGDVSEEAPESGAEDSAGQTPEGAPQDSGQEALEDLLEEELD